MQSPLNYIRIQMKYINPPVQLGFSYLNSKITVWELRFSIIVLFLFYVHLFRAVRSQSWCFAS